MKKLLLFVCGCGLAFNMFAQETVKDPWSIEAINKGFTQLSEKYMEFLKKAQEKNLPFLETIDAANKKINEQTKNVQDWIGKAQDYSIGMVDKLVGIDNIVATQAAAQTCIDTGKKFYGVYETGKGLYETGKNVFESFDEVDGSIDSMRDQLKTLAEARKGVMTQVATLTDQLSKATCSNEAGKNSGAVATAQTNLLTNVGEEVSKVNTTLLMNTGIDNAKERKEEVEWKAYQDANKNDMDSLDPQDRNAKYKELMSSLL